MLQRISQIYQILIMVGFLITGQSVIANDLEQQRKIYLDAKKTLQAGKLTTFQNLLGQLQDYPLYPYLQYNYLRTRLHKVPVNEIRNFIKSFEDFPLIDSLRTKWLKHLANSGQWEMFLEVYTPQDEKSLQCYQLLARIKTRNPTYLLEDTRSVWLSGESLPDQCNSAFTLLYKSDLMTNELVWERVRLAMANGNTGLASYLSKRLDEFYRVWASRWIAMHNAPEKWTKKPQYEDIPIAHEILIHGIKRLAIININMAIKHWDQLQDQYNFTSQEITETNRIVAVRAARKKHPRTRELLDNINNFYVDDDIFHWRLRIALEGHDWQQLHKWTDGVAPYEEIRYRWMYWQARALEQTGDIEAARLIYTAIANKRDYYGFLAADRLGQPYNLEHKPLPDNPELKAKIARLPGIKRAHELRIVGKPYEARREWRHALNFMTTYEKEMAASLAADWDWYEQSIVSMTSAHNYDDLILRFPIPFQAIIDKNIKKRQLDPGWVYALVRSESAFMEDVKSPAGALGLMQVMPQTGKMTAKQIGIKKFHPNDLLKAEKNVPIGSAYLKLMFDQFNGNMVLATAAYNAGPHRVKSWLPKNGCIEPDIWVEKIPFNETWKYVRRVLFFASIYDWRLELDIRPLKDRMTAVNPGNASLVAGLDCSIQQISYN